VDAIAAVEEAVDEARADEAAGASDHHRLAICPLRCPWLLSSSFTCVEDKSSREEGEDKEKGTRKKDGVKR
jgi:hypothetical protein